MNKRYLGDSVYVEDDGYQLILTTENGFGPSNTIIMEPSVVLAFEDYARKSPVLGRQETEEEE